MAEVQEMVVCRFIKYIARKQWFAAGSDDMHVYIYNYNTAEKIKRFEVPAIVPQLLLCSWWVLRPMLITFGLWTFIQRFRESPTRIT